MRDTDPRSDRFLERAAIGVAIAGIAARVLAIGRLPGINGDEAWYGANLQALTMGQPGFWTTPSGNPLNPLHSGLLYLLSLVFEPSLGLLRAPEVLLSILTVVLSYPLLRPSIGARSALVATMLVAASPVAIAYGRLGWDPSGTPFVTLIALALALRDRPMAAAVAALMAVAVHPTNLFFMPIVIAAWLPHARRRSDTATPAMRKGAWLAIALAILGAVAVAGWLLRAAAGNPETLLPSIAVVLDRATSPSVWVAFLRGIVEMFAGVTTLTFVAGPPGLSVRVAAGLLAMIALPAGLRIQRTAAGRGHAWLWLGIAASLALFLIAGGPATLQPGFERYALFVLIPLIIACSIGAGTLPAGWAAGYAVLVAGGMLLVVMAGYFAPLVTEGGRAHATFRTGATEPKLAAFEFVRDHSTGRTVIICEDWWSYWPVRYLAGGDARFSVLLSPDATLPPSVAGRLAPPEPIDPSWPAYEIVFDGTPRWSSLSITPPAFSAVDPAGRPILHVFKVN